MNLYINCSCQLLYSCLVAVANVCFYLTAEELVQKKMEEIHNKVDLQQDVEGAYLTHLLLGEKMTVTEILGSITELLLAGVDTVSTQGGRGAEVERPETTRFPLFQTSNTMSWSLYQLAQNPDIQDQLYQEVISVCPGNKLPDSDDIAQMPYLKAVIRETLRLEGFRVSLFSSPQTRGGYQK